MKMTNLATLFSKKRNEKSKNKIIPLNSDHILSKIDDINNIVVMSGTATRRPFSRNESHSDLKIIQKNNFKESFLKLRAPFYKSHQRQAQTEEKLMNKSCQLLLECIKPYKNIRIAKKTKVKESVRTIGGISKTDIIYERKATRKVQIFSFSEENSLPSLLLNKKTPSLALFSRTASSNFDSENLKIGTNADHKIFDEQETNAHQTRKTVSSEDFITTVFRSDSPTKPSFLT